MDTAVAALLMVLIMIWMMIALILIFLVYKIKRMLINAFSLVFTFTLKPKFRNYKR